MERMVQQAHRHHAYRHRSATSWMADKIVGNQGGLHARVTCNLHLPPFNLHETEEYLRQRNCQWDRYQILQCYMILGGVPYYLSLLNMSDSLVQNIDRLFFTEGALLRNEFDELYNALFANADTYISVVKLLSENKSGMLREDIAKATGLEGAFLSKILKNLECVAILSPGCHNMGKKSETTYSGLRISTRSSIISSLKTTTPKTTGGGATT